MKRLTRFLFLFAAISFSPAAIYAQSAPGADFVQVDNGSFAYEKTFTIRGVSAANMERKLNAWMARTLEPAEGGDSEDGQLCFLVLKEGPNENEFVSFNAKMSFDDGAVTFRARDFVYQSMSSETGNLDVPLQLMPESVKASVFPRLEARWTALMNEMQRAARR